ncbi:MAG: glutamine synthetase type III, partial [Oscillospiraceae bacterium]|nr:glutamine synthetase type III [Oscillospiraceae bacterium]
LEPGETPYENAQFLLFLCAVIKAVDDYQDLLRISVASAGNDHRLGANEAPPAIVSMFIGSELSEVLQAIETDTPYGAKEKELLRVGVHVLPKFPKDSTDRNRTSPFAFTGNKFEFRMLGSANSISGCNTVLNTAVAEELKQFADELENAADFDTALHDLVKRVIVEHQHVIFNGNGYDDSWVAEAEKRGLLNLKTTPDALPYFIHDKNIKLFTSHKVFTEVEIRSRYEINLENYCKVVNIEALTMVDMARKDILPAISEYIASLSASAGAKQAIGPDVDLSYEAETAKELSALSGKAFSALKTLEAKLEETKRIFDITVLAAFYKDEVLAAMDELRAAVDSAEMLTAAEYWPYPSYGELLFGVR